MTDCWGSWTDGGVTTGALCCGTDGARDPTVDGGVIAGALGSGTDGGRDPTVDGGVMAGTLGCGTVTDGGRDPTEEGGVITCWGGDRTCCLAGCGWLWVWT